MNKVRARAKMREKGTKGKGEGDEKGTRGCAYLILYPPNLADARGQSESEGFFDSGNAGFGFSGAALVVSTGEGFADLGLDRDLEVELDLRFGS